MLAGRTYSGSRFRAAWCRIEGVLIVLAVAFGCSVEKGYCQTIILNNLAPGGAATSGDKTYGNISRWAERFTATHTGAISDIKLNLYRTNVNTNGFDDYNVELWSGSGTTPSAQLAILATANWLNTVPLNSGTVNTSSFVNFTTGTLNTITNQALVTSGSSYWLAVTFAGNGPAAKRWTVSGSGFQTASFSALSNTWTAVGSSSSLGAQISVAPVPEIDPSGFGTVLALALGSLALLERRRSVIGLG